MSAIIPTVATTKVTTVTASVSDVGGTITPVYVFDGSTMYATMPDWVPLGLPFSVEVKAIPLTAPVAHGVIYGTGGLYPYIRLTASGVSARYGGAATSPTRTVSVPAVVGELLEVSDVGLATGSVITSNGVEVATPGFVMNVSSVANNYGNIARKPDGTEFFNGPIWDLKLTDSSPIQDTDACIGNTSRYGELLQSITIPAGNDFEISFDWIRQDRTGTSTGPLASSSTVDTIGVNDTGTGFPGRLTFRDETGSSRNFDDVLLDVALGQHCRCKFTYLSGVLRCFVDERESSGTKSLSGAVVILRIGRAVSGVGFSAGSAIQNLVIKDLTQSLTYTFPLDEGAGTVINNTDPTTGAAYNGNWTPDTDWQNIPNNSRYYPMRDGIPGAGVLQDVIGGHDATIVNYDEANWDYEQTQTITTASNAGSIGWLKDNYGDISRQLVQGYQRRMTSVRVDTVGDMAYIEWDIENLYPDITGIFLYWNGIGLLLNRTTPTSGLFSVAIPPTPETNWIAADGIERGISITAVKG